MLAFSFTCVTDVGQYQDGLIQAPSWREARHKLQERGWKVVHLDPSVQAVRARARAMPLLQRLTAARPARLSAQGLGVFTLQLEVMLNAGLTCTRALDILARSGDKAMARVAGELCRSIDCGGTLSQAMQAMPLVFDAVYVRMVRVGEESGRLPHMLGLLAARLRNQHDRLGRLMAALTYPACILLTSLGMAAFMVYYMLPGYLVLFSRAGAEMPVLTLALLGMRNFAMYGFVIATAASLAALVAARFSLRWRGRLDALKLRLPVVRGLLQDYALAVFCRNMAVLLDSGVPALTALNTLGRPGTGLPALDAGLRAAGRRLKNGASLAGALSDPIFPRFITGMVSVGESTGDVGPLLTRTSALLEERLEHRINNFLTIVEPCVMLFMGIVVGCIVLATFLPVFQMMQLR